MKDFVTPLVGSLLFITGGYFLSFGIEGLVAGSICIMAGSLLMSVSLASW